MKDDVNDEVPNGIPKTLIPSIGVLNQNGVSKSKDNQRGTMLHIYEVKQKDLSHEVWFENVHIQMIQLKDL